MSSESRKPSVLDVLFERDVVNGPISRGWVESVDGNGVVYVHANLPDEDAVLACDRLTVAEGAELVLAPGDMVLYLDSRPAGSRGVILGRIGPSHAPPVSAPEQDTGVADELVLEAKSSLTLRVGDGSITIRADGKILIKGKDLVSHAQRVNRIKGGSVSIN